jgi:hypothetical protein
MGGAGRDRDRCASDQRQSDGPPNLETHALAPWQGIFDLISTGRNVASIGQTARRNRHNLETISTSAGSVQFSSGDQAGSSAAPG